MLSSQVMAIRYNARYVWLHCFSNVSVYRDCWGCLHCQRGEHFTFVFSLCHDHNDDMVVGSVSCCHEGVLRCCMLYKCHIFWVRFCSGPSDELQHQDEKSQTWWQPLNYIASDGSIGKNICIYHGWLAWRRQHRHRCKSLEHQVTIRGCNSSEALLAIVSE